MDTLVKCHVHSVLFLYFDESSTPFTYYLPTSLKLSDKEPEPVSGDIGACNFFNKGTARGHRTASFWAATAAGGKYSQGQVAPSNWCPHEAQSLKMSLYFYHFTANQ